MAQNSTKRSYGALDGGNHVSPAKRTRTVSGGSRTKIKDMVDSLSPQATRRLLYALCASSSANLILLEKEFGGYDERSATPADVKDFGSYPKVFSNILNHYAKDYGPSQKSVILKDLNDVVDGYCKGILKKVATENRQADALESLRRIFEAACMCKEQDMKRDIIKHRHMLERIAVTMLEVGKSMSKEERENFKNTGSAEKVKGLKELLGVTLQPLDDTCALFWPATTKPWNHVTIEEEVDEDAKQNGSYEALEIPLEKASANVPATDISKEHQEAIQELKKLESEGVDPTSKQFLQARKALDTFHQGRKVEFADQVPKATAPAQKAKQTTGSFQLSVKIQNREDVSISVEPLITMFSIVKSLQKSEVLPRHTSFHLYYKDKRLRSNSRCGDVPLKEGDVLYARID
ncbi:hypothetical protein PVAG01_00999 [Phlyctema vagabunda]|uniref:Rad60/SUMO-like domain-containing protein n=1 Tax=Phlyctema vagabunda TaxID=108571 RepID=A0ABR4PW76_9HELO